MSVMQRGLKTKPSPGFVGEMAGENVTMFWLQSSSRRRRGSYKEILSGFRVAAGIMAAEEANVIL